MTAGSAVFKCVKGGTQGRGGLLENLVLFLPSVSMRQQWINLIGIYDPMSDI